MNAVQAGQVWSCNGFYGNGERPIYVIVAIDEDRGVAIVRFSPSGRISTKRLRSLRHGLGGNRIEIDTAGRIYTDKDRGPINGNSVLRGTDLERKTASELKKVHPPRGLSRRQRDRWRRAAK